MNIVISDPETGKAYNKKSDKPVFLNRKLGEEVDLASIGLGGFKAKITGGSDKQGFPLKPSLVGSTRKKVLLRKGVGIRAKRKGEIRRKSVRGNTINAEVVQLNMVITQQGEKKQVEALKPGAKKKEDEKESAKERMIKTSLDSIGKAELAAEAKKIKGKVRH